jgi:hypothetical protein
MASRPGTFLIYVKTTSIPNLKWTSRSESGQGRRCRPCPPTVGRSTTAAISLHRRELALRAKSNRPLPAYASTEGLGARQRRVEARMKRRLRFWIGQAFSG